jgi:hypothetical protein
MHGVCRSAELAQIIALQWLSRNGDSACLELFPASVLFFRHRFPYLITSSYDAMLYRGLDYFRRGEVYR